MKKGCDKISHLLSDSFDRKLSWIERIEVKIHLSMCSLCSSYAQNITIMHDIFSYIRHINISENIQLSKMKKSEIQKALKDQCDD
ncbi:MAG: zf-HC2 domain-containing protein [Mariprofundaceae bacterium]|nr:zf-HC2 domain-containing protein [Mariprofundaceae bacterium]